MSWLDRKAHYQALAKTIDPSIRIYSKDCWLWRAYAWIPFLLTLGRSSRQDFIEQTATIIGPLHFYPPTWSDIGRELRHEGRHTRQQRYFGLGTHPWVGFIPWALAAVLILPAGLTVRFWLEMDAEVAALRYKFKTGSSAVWVRHELIEFAKRLSGPGYLWSWPQSWAVRIAEARAEEFK